MAGQGETLLKIVTPVDFETNQGGANHKPLTSSQLRLSRS